MYTAIRLHHYERELRRLLDTFKVYDECQDVQIHLKSRYGSITVGHIRPDEEKLNDIHLVTHMVLDDVFYHPKMYYSKTVHDMCIEATLTHNVYYDIHIVNYAMNDVIYNATNMMRGYSNDRTAKKRGLSK